MNHKSIRSWRATAAINSDDTELALQYTDGSQTVSKNLPPARFAALIAVLESAQAATVHLDAKGQPWLTNAPNAPGE